MDEDVTTNDLVGSTKIKMSSFTRVAQFDEWFEIKFEGKSAGTVHLKTHWIPDPKK